MYLANLAVTDERRENMLNIMKKANAMLNKVFTGLSVALLAVVIVATALQVFTRSIMNASLSGTDEVARL